MRHLRAVLATTLVLCLASATVSGAAPPWSPPTTLSWPGQTVDEVVLGMNGGGDAVALWSQFGSLPLYLDSASRAPGGAFAPSGLTVRSRAFWPDVAIAPSGEAVAVWSEWDGRSDRLMAAIRPPGGSFGRPAALSEVNRSAFSGRVAIAPSGEAVAVWQRGDDVVQAAIRPPGESFGPVDDLTPVAAHDPDVAIAPSGEAVAAWAGGSISGRLIRGAVRMPGGAFGRGLDLSGASASALIIPTVAMDPAGNGTIVWTWDGIVQAATHPAGRGFAAGVDDVSAVGETASLDADVGVDSNGTAIAVWTGGTGGATPVQTATRPLGESFGPPLPISSGDASDADVAINPAGTAVAAWREATAGGPVVRAATRPAGGVFGAAVDVSATGVEVGGVQAAIDDEGSALAVWARATDSSWIAETSYLDVAAPQLNGLSVPSVAETGRPMAVSVSALDVWSSFTVAWSFGDGGTATSVSASHVYTATGTYTVTVTATDATGRTTSATRQVSVFHPPPNLAPQLSALKLTPAAFRAAASGPSVAAAAARDRARRRGRAGPPMGSRVTFRLSQSATVRFAVERRAAGRRVGGLCVRATRRTRGARACTRWIPVSGGFTRDATTGPTSFAFSGRLNGRKLPPARYRLLATPTAGGPSGATATAPFRILPPPARRRARRR